VFEHAIVRLPAKNFADGLTTVNLGVPNFDKVLEQHDLYCEALRYCGLTLTTLGPDFDHPDSAFVEDTAILTRPGALSREGEVLAIEPTIKKFFPSTFKIAIPGTLDGGDICEAENHFFIGLSHRTNQEGTAQLAILLAREGYTSSVVDVRPMATILHLKSGISYIGDNTLVVMEEMAADPQFATYNLIRVSPEDSYAANCIRVNDHASPKPSPPAASILSRSICPSSKRWTAA
jgi:dimethylargininase